jgi:hypothetical protein
LRFEYYDQGSEIKEAAMRWDMEYVQNLIGKPLGKRGNGLEYNIKFMKVGL